MNPFVGVSKQFLSEAELRALVTQLATQHSYYFLRWTDKVSGIKRKLPDDFLSPEGQMFNSQLELRWKQRGINYEVLLLSVGQPNLASELKALPGEWKVGDRLAYFHDADETRFPKGFSFEEGIDPKKFPVGQRYFQDAETAIVHFVALTVETVEK